MKIPEGLIGNTMVLAKPTRRKPRYSAGSMIQVDKGTLMVAYEEFYQNTSDDHDPAQILGRYSKDYGKRWGKPILLQPNSALKNVMQPSLLKIGQELLMFYLRKNSTSDLKVHVKRSKNNGKDWYDEVCVTTESGFNQLNNDRVILLNNGRILAPIGFCRDVAVHPHFVSYCYYSDDNGYSWKRGSGMVDIGGIGADEPGVVEVGNKVMMFIRSNLGSIYRAFSNDSGENWSEAEPIQLQSPDAPCAIRKIPNDDDYLIVWTNSDKNRCPLTLALSSDCDRWYSIKVIQADNMFDYGYPSILFVNNRVFITYWVRDRRTMGLRNGWGLVSLCLTKINVKQLYE